MLFVFFFFYCKQNPFLFTTYERHFHKYKYSRDYHLLSVNTYTFIVQNAKEKKTELKEQSS